MSEQFKTWQDACDFVTSVVSVLDETGTQICTIMPGDTPEYYDGVLASQIVNDHNQAEALRAELHKARELLAQWVEDGPGLDPEGKWRHCCGAPVNFYGVGHEPNCPWLLAKQYLEPTP